MVASAWQQARPTSVGNGFLYALTSFNASGASPTRQRDGHEGITSPATEITRLNELHDAGAITDQEYDRAKQIALHPGGA